MTDLVIQQYREAIRAIDMAGKLGHKLPQEFAIRCINHIFTYLKSKSVDEHLLPENIAKQLSLKYTEIDEKAIGGFSNQNPCLLNLNIRLIKSGIDKKGEFLEQYPSEKLLNTIYHEFTHLLQYHTNKSMPFMENSKADLPEGELRRQLHVPMASFYDALYPLQNTEQGANLTALAMMYEASELLNSDWLYNYVANEIVTYSDLLIKRTELIAKKGYMSMDCCDDLIDKFKNLLPYNPKQNMPNYNQELLSLIGSAQKDMELICETRNNAIEANRFRIDTDHIAYQLIAEKSRQLSIVNIHSQQAIDIIASENECIISPTYKVSLPDITTFHSVFAKSVQTDLYNTALNIMPKFFDEACFNMPRIRGMAYDFDSGKENYNKALLNAGIKNPNNISLSISEQIKRLAISALHISHGKTNMKDSADKYESVPIEDSFFSDGEVSKGYGSLVAKKDDDIIL